jgi:hypothetical protein
MRTSQIYLQLNVITFIHLSVFKILRIIKCKFECHIFNTLKMNACEGNHEPSMFLHKSRISKKKLGHDRFLVKKKICKAHKAGPTFCIIFFFLSYHIIYNNFLLQLWNIKISCYHQRREWNLISITFYPSKNCGPMKSSINQNQKQSHTTRKSLNDYFQILQS